MAMGLRVSRAQEGHLQLLYLRGLAWIQPLLIILGLFRMGNWIHVAADQRALRLGICLIKKHLKELSSEVP